MLTPLPQWLLPPPGLGLARQERVPSVCAQESGEGRPSRWCQLRRWLVSGFWLFFCQFDVEVWRRIDRQGANVRTRSHVNSTQDSGPVAHNHGNCCQEMVSVEKRLLVEDNPRPGPTFRPIRESCKLLLQRFHLGGHSRAEVAQLLQVLKLGFLFVDASNQRWRRSCRARTRIAGHGWLPHVGGEWPRRERHVCCDVQTSGATLRLVCVCIYLRSVLRDLQTLVKCVGDAGQHRPPWNAKPT